MDITFIGSGYSVLAVLYYITDYISKQQLKTHVAYNLLEHALLHLNQYNESDDTDHVQAKRILMRCTNAVISKQELSTQQIASYLLGSSDFYTSHSFKDFYWKSYEGYIIHCLPDADVDDLHPSESVLANEDDVHANDPASTSINDGHHSDAESDSTSDILDVRSALSFDDLILDESPLSSVDLTDPLCDLLANSAIQCNEYVMVTIDSQGQLKPKAMTVSDYLYHPKAMLHLCLWDFLTMTKKIHLSRKSTSTPDDFDSDNGLSLHEGASIDMASIDIMESMYVGSLKTSTFALDERHPDHSTHAIQIIPPAHHYTLVPLGPPIP